MTRTHRLFSGSVTVSGSDAPSDSCDRSGEPRGLKQELKILSVTRFRHLGAEGRLGRYFILWMIVAAGVLGAGLVWSISGDSRNRSVRLADGREFTLRAVTFGKEHRYVHGKPWLKALVLILPARWHSRFGLAVLSYKTEVFTIMFWGSWRGGSVVPPFPPTVDDASVTDLRGSECEPMRFQASAYPGGGETVLGWNFANFPRREKRVGLRLYFRDNEQKPNFVGECHIPNPACREYPAWEGSAPPITRTNGDWEFTFLRFVTGEPIPAKLKPSRGYLAPWTHGAFRITRKGEMSELWQVAGVEVRDATGNFFQHTFLTAGPPINPVAFGCNSMLWPGETGWKLEVEFARTGEFTPEDLWAVKGVPVPELNIRTTSELHRTIHGVTIGGVELSVLPAGPWMKPAGMLSGTVNVRVVPPVRGVRINLVGVMDEQGRQLRSQSAYINPIGFYGFNLMIPTNSRALDFTFAAQQSYVLEFLARPGEGY